MIIFLIMVLEVDGFKEKILCKKLILHCAVKFFFSFFSWAGWPIWSNQRTMVKVRALSKANDMWRKKKSWIKKKKERN